MNEKPAVAVCVSAALAACAGPEWTVAPPADAAVYLDGRRQARSELPARYYGTVAVDAVPVPPQKGLDPFRTAPARMLTTHDEPVTPWLFPLDFPLECLVRLFHDTPPLPLSVALQTNVPHLTGIMPADIDQIRTRAFAARTAR